MKKLNIAVMFGGRAVEHEISIITGLQLIKALDPEKYMIYPIYIAPSGKWYYGDKLFEKSIYKNFAKFENNLSEVTLLPKPKLSGLTILKKGKNFNLKNITNNTIPIDVFFPAFHGEIGEDGRIQGLFEMAEVAFVGNSVTPAAIAMNKQLCKLILKSVEIPVLPSFVINKFDFLKNSESQINQLLKTHGLEFFPLFVKPCNRGSSVGISKAKDKEELIISLLNVFKIDLQAIVEPFVANMYEINIAVMDAEEVIASVVEIPHSETGVLSYEEKYMRGGSKKNADESQGMASLTRVINPDNLPQEIKDTVTNYAIKAFKTLGCSGNGRFDFMVDKDSNQIYFNELNPCPGSLAFYLWVESNPRLLYTEVLDKMINSAIRNHQNKSSLQSFIGFKALN